MAEETEVATITLPKYGFHELADIFPQMLGEEYDDLYASVEKGKRVHDPIVLVGDDILDGRHRWRTVNDLAERGIPVEYQVRQFDPETDGDMIDFVTAKNYKRRHLTVTQKANIALKYYDMFRGKTKPGRKSANDEAKEGQARERAAAVTGVSGKTVSTLASVRDSAPDLMERMFAGEMTVWQAAAEAKKRAEQKEHSADAKTGHQTKPENQIPWENVTQARVHFGDDPVKVDAWIYERPQADGTVNWLIVVEEVRTPDMEGKPRTLTLHLSGTRGDAKRRVYTEYVAWQPKPEVPDAPADTPSADTPKAPKKGGKTKWQAPEAPAAQTDDIDGIERVKNPEDNAVQPDAPSGDDVEIDI